MPVKTTNYELVKPNLNESADINVINENMNIIDENLKILADTKQEKLNFATVATSGSYTDLSNKPTSLPANGGSAATAAKLLNQRTITLAGDISGSIQFDGSTNVSANMTVRSGNADTVDNLHASDLIQKNGDQTINGKLTANAVYGAVWN